MWVGASVRLLMALAGERCRSLRPPAPNRHAPELDSLRVGVRLLCKVGAPVPRCRDGSGVRGVGVLRASFAGYGPAGRRRVGPDGEGLRQCAGAWATPVLSGFGKSHPLRVPLPPAGDGSLVPSRQRLRAEAEDPGRRQSVTAASGPVEAADTATRRRGEGPGTL